MAVCVRPAPAALAHDGFQLLPVNTVTNKATGESTVKPIARSTALRPHEATGASYDAALVAYRSTVPEGWQEQNMHEVAE